MEVKKLLYLLNEMNDVEVIVLRAYDYGPAGEFHRRHRDVLVTPQAHLGSSQEVVDKQGAPVPDPVPPPEPVVEAPPESEPEPVLEEREEAEDTPPSFTFDAPSGFAIPRAPRPARGAGSEPLPLKC